jgi:23S rRNA (adenine2030-N6)-methyltransferase
MSYPATMNYRHAYHAGNHADVLKHVVLLSMLDALSRKETPYFVLDTHAGRGRYDLQAEEAGKTGEADSGVTQLLAWARNARPLPSAIARYRDALRGEGEEDGRRHYPGSPLLASRAMRSIDRLAACELQPAEAEALKTLFGGAANSSGPRVEVHARDGYGAMKAMLPPKEKRGLVLIDPPYETQGAEFDAVIAALRDAFVRWPTGCFAVWYPIKQRRTMMPFLRKAAALPCKQALVAELLVRPDDSPLRMNGSGMVLLNPPWKLDAEIAGALPSLAKALGEPGAAHRLEWIKKEEKA